MLAPVADAVKEDFVRVLRQVERKAAISVENTIITALRELVTRLRAAPGGIEPFKHA